MTGLGISHTRAIAPSNLLSPIYIVKFTRLHLAVIKDFVKKQTQLISDRCRLLNVKKNLVWVIFLKSFLYCSRLDPHVFSKG